ncbi:AraC family transcriptional regulator [uncultured Dysosmobacter sp.]|uniref:helix-turn-helix domain-containing protein n=1 Tax=uncultured Dysosmobacter sp. TaxID=2591384 RepID=UPI00260DF343|nr:AraC family transcriptional regulator [uncultured Dysosmobacter sp.]
MEHPDKTVAADHDLHIEAYHFQGLSQPFPLHFHAHYVLGLAERGTRCLSCKRQEATLHPGELLLLNPGDSHACTQCGDEPLDYRSVNIPIETMLDLSMELTGSRTLPVFSAAVIGDQEIACQFRAFHELLLNGASRFAKEESLFLLMANLTERYAQFQPAALPECRTEVEHACAYMDRHFMERITLDQLCRRVGLSKSTLLRSFTQARGITPYRYLETVRVSAAKALLEQGVPPLEAAMRTGFSDQSHFTNHFTSFIGLPPGLYRDILQGRGKGEQHGLST